MAARLRAADPPPASAHQSAQDAWQAETWTACGLAIGRWLEERGRLDQPIAILKRHELAGMAWAAVAEWLERREVRRQELRLAGPPGDPLADDPMDRLMGA